MGTNVLSMPAETKRVDTTPNPDATYTHLTVFTKSALVEQTTPVEANGFSKVSLVDPDPVRVGL